MPVPVLWWIIAACVCVVLPAALAFVGDEPDNAVTHEQENESRRDPDAAEMTTAA